MKSYCDQCGWDQREWKARSTPGPKIYTYYDERGMLPPSTFIVRIQSSCHERFGQLGSPFDLTRVGELPGLDPYMPFLGVRPCS